MRTVLIRKINTISSTNLVLLLKAEYTIRLSPIVLKIYS
jgi:hypothetical protein